MSPSLRPLAAALLVAVLSGCRLDDAPAPAPPASDAPAAVTTTGDDRLPSARRLEADRLGGRGRRDVGADTSGFAAAARSNPETLADVDSATDWSGRLHLPLGGDVEGPSVVQLQVLLDRAGFSPGVIDGRWGDNTELAVSWFQKAEGLPVSGIVDEATARALSERAQAGDRLVTPRRLTEEDVAGPFVDVPDDVYERAEMDRLGFESLAEKLGERFHATPDLLARLNDGVALDSLAAGDTLRVPAVRSAPPTAGPVARLEISASAGYLHALTAEGDLVFHAPVTVGASYDPSPEGTLRVESITRDPWWHYQPSILASVLDDEPEARLPPGPNNAVGVVWMALSKEHYGIHGTSAPETIGYASSAGCVRLTNWDALHLAGLLSAGTPVRFLGPADAGPEATADSTARRAAGTG